MKKYLLIVFILSLTGSDIYAQSYNVRIDVQIIGYDGTSEFKYYLNTNNFHRNPQIVKPDKNGRFTVSVKIEGINYFWFYFRNEGDRNHESNYP